MMTSVLVAAIICGSALIGLHLWLTARVGAYADRCACGHAAAFHKERGGCRHTHDGSTDCYGYCTCERTFAEVSRGVASRGRERVVN